MFNNKLHKGLKLLIAIGALSILLGFLFSDRIWPAIYYNTFVLFINKFGGFSFSNDSVCFTIWLVGSYT